MTFVKVGLLVAVVTGVHWFATGKQEVKKEPVARVRFYLSTECPVAAKYTPRILSIVRDFEGKGVTFEARFPNAADDEPKVSEYARARSYRFDCLLDPGGMEAQSDRVKVVPTVVVRDARGRLVYRGAIDDAKYSEDVQEPYLRDVLRALLDGRTWSFSETEAFGCLVEPGPRPLPMRKSTYTESVGDLLNRHCVSCHRPGQVAPFSLVGYDNAKKRHRMIAQVTQSRRMPPWKAEPGVVPFKHDNRLSEADVALLQRWSDAGAPRGEGTEPKTPDFPTDWPLGEPDMTVKMPEKFTLGPDGRDEYWNFVVRPDIKEPVFVSAIDVRPGNRRIVHHVIVFLDRSGRAARQAAQGKAGGFMTFGGIGTIPSGSLGGWAPGLMPERYPPGTGIRIDPGTDLVLQVHYSKSGVEETDQTEVALYFEKGKVQDEVTIAWLANPLIQIPAGKSDARFTQTIPIPVDVKLYSLMPHMHLLGRKMKATWIKPDGQEALLIKVDDWDFNWQFVYHFEEPLLLTRGSKLRIEAEFDNSDGNPNNPSRPPKTVRWGEATTDEMMLLVASVSIQGRWRLLGSRF
ncbi:MAG: hypothetical protein KF884_02230 [Fimbriimonadaceae bacterium]|nr:hypothetical protein [Fimbriimonadaceae bacterium]QYK58913.1 MAG: hypothetical protein KF884_02230 [Fimbriimonadaceae bacterium]